MSNPIDRTYKDMLLTPLSSSQATTDITTELALDALGLGAVSMAYDAVTISVDLDKRIEAAIKRGESVAEAIICQTGSVISKTVVSNAIKGAILTGIPVYLTFITAQPEFAGSLPAVARLVVTAYQGADLNGQQAGILAEALCHANYAKKSK